MANRRQIVSQAVKAHSPRTANGGVTAPKNAPKNPGPALGGKRRVPGGIRGGTMPLAGPNPSATGAAPPPTAAPTPWSARYEQRVGNAQKTYLDATANYDLAEQTAKQDYGIDPGFNDHQSNPNSRAAALEQAYLRNNQGTMNSAGLQLYSGSTSNRLASNRSNYGVNRDQLMKSYRDALNEISQGRTDAAQAKSDEGIDAYWDSVSEAEDAPLDPAAAPPKKKPQKKKDRKQQTKQAVAAARPAQAPKKKGKK